MSRSVVVCAAFAAISWALPAAAQVPASAAIKVGMLNCNMSPSVGFVVGGRTSLACRFEPSVSHMAPESYLGEITTIGLDIGATSGGKLAWAVFMPERGTQPGALAGDYVGASGQVAVGVGVGANVLVGGSDRAVTLQPFSVEGDKGLNLAVGVSGMALRRAP
jgi:hypothetical protein